MFGTDGGRLAAGQSPAGFRFRQRHGFAAAVRGASLGLGRTEVAATGSWDGSTVRTRCGADGKWMLKLKTPDAGGPYTVTVSDGETVTLENVLIGEVWICSGQSNMEMPVGGWGRVRDRKRRLASDTSVRRQAGFQFGSEGRCTGRRRRLAALLAADGSRLFRRRLLFRPRVA